MDRENYNTKKFNSSLWEFDVEKTCCILLQSWFCRIINHMQHIFLRQILTKMNWISYCHNFCGPLEKKLPRLHSSILHSFCRVQIYFTTYNQAQIDKKLRPSYPINSKTKIAYYCFSINLISFILQGNNICCI